MVSEKTLSSSTSDSSPVIPIVAGVLGAVVLILAMVVICAFCVYWYGNRVKYFDVSYQLFSNISQLLISLAVECAYIIIQS